MIWTESVKIYIWKLALNYFLKFKALMFQMNRYCLKWSFVVNVIVCFFLMRPLHCQQVRMQWRKWLWRQLRRKELWDNKTSMRTEVLSNPQRTDDGHWVGNIFLSFGGLTGLRTKELETAMKQWNTSLFAFLTNLLLLPSALTLALGYHSLEADVHDPHT